MARRVIVISVALLVAGCSEAQSSAWDEASDDRDLMTASWIDPDAERGGGQYAAFDEARDRAPSGDFMGFGCLDSCAGHEAGYAWAGEHGIGRPADCDGNSWSFVEGCVAWAVENYEASDEERPERGLY